MKHGYLAVAALALAACGGEGRPAPAADSAADSAALGAGGAAAAPSSMVADARILATIGDSTSHVEGLAVHDGKLYTADWKDGAIYRIDPAAGRPEKVGQLPTKPGQAILGIEADSAGNLYAAVPDIGVIYRVDAKRLGAKDFNAKRDARPFATGAPGANGLVFDRRGHLWIGGGDKGALYHVGPAGGKAAVFARDYSPISTDTTMPVRMYVVNGVALDAKGNVYTLNTGTGEVTRIAVDSGYKPGAITSFVKDTQLLGADGLIADEQDNLWMTANFRNTLARISPRGEVTIVFTDTPGDSAIARANGGAGGNVLRFPAELERISQTIYLSNLNFPIGANTGQHPGATIASLTLK
jgi:sugar lactone lactonase YvrE